ncbi:phage antirepressor N-terminal domain-containing protein [Lonsdalea quercina]|uniref:phage antirepressor N-terminal domain-containing protein n=1 Tax=Lonsdalea quercina TaxID=71657 RepID=UPI00047EFCCD|nr:phage antirepressor N-terminal domain-containing protein [Lonsdalea quercina]
MASISIIEAVNTSVVQFHGQQIITSMVSGIAYVAMRPIVENIGIDWAAQFVKLKKQSEKYGCCDIATPSSGGLQKMLCIPLRKLNGWLFSINPAKVRADIRDKLIQYQEECFTALYNYWTKGAAVRKEQETSVDDRTPLRGIVNRIMGKYGMTYQAVYKLVHKEFGVKHIEELSPKQTAEAIEYLAAKAIEGEFLGKDIQSASVRKQFTDNELCELAWLWKYSQAMIAACKDVYPLLDVAEHRLAARFFSIGHEYPRTINKAREFLRRETSHIEYQPRADDNWSRVLPHLRQILNQ